MFKNDDIENCNFDFQSNDLGFTMRDIYYKMNYALISTHYSELEISGKKKIVEQEMRKYIISKILELNPKIKIDKDIDLCLLAKILGDMIPKEKHSDTISHLTHFILQVASSMQGFHIIWSSKNITEPVLKYKDNDYIDELITSEDMDLVSTFEFIFDIFKNHFMIDNFVKRIQTIN